MNDMSRNDSDFRLRQGAIPLPTQHYLLQSDAARLDLMQQHAAYVEIGRGGPDGGGYVYLETEEDEGFDPDRRWLGGICGKPACEERFETMREALDWVVVGISK
jgi:hypothetical protein